MFLVQDEIGHHNPMLQKDNKIVLGGFQQILTETQSEFNQYEDKSDATVANTDDDASTMHMSQCWLFQQAEMFEDVKKLSKQASGPISLSFPLLQ